MEYKYYLSPQTDPYYNLAAEQYLARFVRRDVAILYLWQNRRAIIVGKNQNVAAECRAAEFERSGGSIARRKSGGGAVYHDMGNLCVSVLAPQTADGDLYWDLMRKALAGLGIAAVSTENNDLVVQGRKISGSAFFEDGNVRFSHGTVLVDCDMEQMAGYLTPSEAKLEKHFVKSVASRTMNLKELDDSLTIGKVIRAFLETSGAKAFSPDMENEELSELRSFFCSREWVYGKE